ncbi:MAG: arginine--tRNA ligase [Alkaliphilus sp.]
MINYKEKIAEALADNIKEINKIELLNMIEVPPNLDMGDFAFPCFGLAKIFRKTPNMIAEELAGKIVLSKIFDKVSTSGGYLNFFFDRNIFVSNILNEVIYKEGKFGDSTIGEGKTICIDFSAPNVAKPFHVGHLRSTVIGNSIYKINEFLGYNCVGINHLGDWGTQFGKVIVAYRNWGSKEEIEKSPISTLLALYVKFHDEAEKKPVLEDEAREWFVKMENGDEEAMSLWKWFSAETIKELKNIYKRLGVEFDYFTGESFYNDKMSVVTEELASKKLLKESKGALIVDLDEYNMPPCLVQKTDGSTLYATRDLAAAFYRKNAFNFYKSLYVTDYSQKLHFAQVFKVIELMGHSWERDNVHVPFGRVSHEGKRIQTRKGTIVLLDDVLKGAVEKVKEIIEEKNPNLENKETIAEDVGIGAIIFNDLSNSRIKDISFSWDTAFNFDGETGPYVQYTHARACSVLRRGGEEVTLGFKSEHLTDDITIKLLKELFEFPNAIEDAQKKSEPSIITRHIINVAQAFNRFYNEYQIIVEDKEIRKARHVVVAATKQVLSTGLYLLGIKAPERM